MICIIVCIMIGRIFIHSYAVSSLVLVVTGQGYSFTCVSYLDGFSEISEASVSTLAARKPDAPSIVAIAPGVGQPGPTVCAVKLSDYWLSVLARRPDKSYSRH